MKGKVDKTVETREAVWFGESGPEVKTGGRAGAGGCRDENVEVYSGSDTDRWDQE